MSRRVLLRAIGPALALPVHKPRTTLAVVAVLTGLALLGVSRLRPDTSLQAMFPKGDPAADAMVRVLNEFAAAEELLVLVEVPDDATTPPGPQRERLLGFAARFEQALTNSPDAAALVNGVLYRADPDTRQFFQNVLVPSALFYLDDATLAEARQRLTPDGIRRQLRRNAALLAQPGAAAGAAAEIVKNDPLRLHEFLKPRFAASAGPSPFAAVGPGESDAPMLSPDGRALLIRVTGSKPPSDLEFCRELVSAATRASDVSNTDGLRVSFGGAYAIATTSERALRADSASSVTGAFACLIGLFAVVYRRPVRLLLLAVGPLALGSVLGFGAYAIVERSMTILSAAVGAMMVGMGIDYSVHYLTHYEKRRGAGRDARDAARETSTDLVAALFAAWLTSILGFAVVGTSDIPALGTFALLGSLGLAGVFVTSLTVIPALLVLSDRDDSAAARVGSRARLRVSVDPLLAWIERHGRACIAVSLLIFVVALGIGFTLPGPILALEPDLTVMHPRPNPALQTQDAVARRFGSVPGSLIVHLRASTPQELVALAHRVDERLRAAGPRDAGVAGGVGLATVLPDPAVVERRMADVSSGEAERVVSDFGAALAESDFDPAAFEKYADFLRELLSRRVAPRLSDLLYYRGLGQTMLPSVALQPGAVEPTEAITLVTMRYPIDERDQRAAAVSAVRSALSDLPGATLTGLPVLGHEAEARVERAVPRLFGLSLILVLAYVLVHFRSPRDAMLSLTTAAFGMVVLLAVMRLSGIKLNMINLIGLPLLIGMTVDYGIFLVSLARVGREHVGSAGQAVLVCAGSTLLGFGSLAFTSVPAVRSLGIVVVVGMAAALAGALFLLAPLLLSRRTFSATATRQTEEC